MRAQFWKGFAWGSATTATLFGILNRSHPSVSSAVALILGAFALFALAEWQWGPFLWTEDECLDP